MPVDLVLRAAALTDVGKVRTGNEDVVLVREDLDLYVVCDGAGGHRSGEVASALAARSLGNYFGATIRRTHEQPEFDRFGIPGGARRLSAAILKANGDVLEISKSDPKHKGMGTTVVAACFSPRSGLMHVGHVGDSRCYRLRSGHLELLTQDHSLLTDVIEQRPELDDTVLERLPKNIVTRALGIDPKLRVSLRSYAVVAGDRYLLCSDGLSGMLTAQELAVALGAHVEPTIVVADLVERANRAGGRDNISALVIECTQGPEADSVPPPPPGVLAQVREAEARSDPELLILGIEELESLDRDSASDDLLHALQALLGKRP
ncbi:MAG TPA: protein phosphatase 2C domain-containing protein [Polyangiaceae bacterium]|jgi:protein phosphatase|nr:protein phosphatase 2C domain-containing protein [Polyangiaceae bacterium]